MLKKSDKFKAFIFHLNKDKISNIAGFIWIIGFVCTIVDTFYFQSKFRFFTLCFYYYITPFFLLITIVRIIISIKRLKNKR